MTRPTSSLARQVEELRKLVEQHLERSRPRLRLQIIFDDGTSDEEIERLQAQAAADAGIKSERSKASLVITNVVSSADTTPRVEGREDK